MERGEVQYRNRYKQVRDFRSMRWGNITPTDIEVAIDFRNLLTVYCELKVEGKDVPYGQRLFLERQNDDIQRGGKDCFTLIAVHSTPPEIDIDVASCRVIEYRHNSQWNKSITIYTVKEFIDKILKHKKISFWEES